MVGVRCSRSAVWCFFGVLNMCGTSSFVAASLRGVVMMLPPVLRGFSVAEIRKRQDEVKAEAEWGQQDPGSRYCYGNL